MSFRQADTEKVAGTVLPTNHRLRGEGERKGDILLWQLNQNVPFSGSTRNVAHASALPGDWGYIKNYGDYMTKHPNGAYMGENVIAIGQDMFVGFPKLRSKTYDQWVQTLESEYFGRNLIPAHPPSFPGWQNDDNQFLDIATIDEKVFKYRSSH